MPLSKIEAVEDLDEDSDEYLDTAKEIVPCPGDGNFFFHFGQLKIDSWLLKVYGL